MRYVLRETVGWKTALITAPAQFLYALSSAHVNNNLPIIANALEITTAIASWIINIELLIVVVTATMTGKLAEKFGTPLIFSIGTALFAIFNLLFLIPAIETSLAGVLALRAGSSIGLGLILPSSTPLAYQLVKPNMLPVAIAFISIMVPIGMIFSALIAGAVAQSSSWRYMFVITGCVAVIYFVAQVLSLPYKVPTRPSKIDFLGVFQLAVGISLFIIALTGLSDKFIPQYASAIILILGVAILVFFFYYNKKWSKTPIFSLELFNKSTIIVEILIFLNNTVQYCQSFYMPYVQIRLANYTPTLSGVVIAITGTGAFLFSPIGNFAFRKLISKRSIFVFYLSYSILIIFNGFQVRYFLKIPLYATLNFLGMGHFVATTIVLTNYNFQASPGKFANQIGVFNQIVTNAGHSVGVSAAVLVNSIFGGEGRNLTQSSVFAVYIFAGCLGFIIVGLSFAMGVFRFERGKVGFSEHSVHRTSTFDENLLNDGEVVEIDQWSEAQRFESKSKLTMFSGMQM